MTDRTALLEALGLSVRAGFLGTTPEEAVAHADRFGALLDGTERVLDLGSGGGVPGLVLAVEHRSLQVVLLDNRRQRTDLLARLVLRLGLSDRVRVLRSDAELAGHDPTLRGSFDVVTARSFGSPAVVAECGAPFLRLGGRLLVSEPPVLEPRWPSAGLALVGLECVPCGDPGLAVFTATRPCPWLYPRRARSAPIFA
jgi:16S rRNA (guanine527-N7)-methyltransferase